MRSKKQVLVRASERYSPYVTSLTLAIVLFFVAISAFALVASGVLALGPDAWYQPPRGGEMTRSELVRTVLLLGAGPAVIATSLAIVGSGHALLYTYLGVGGVVCAGEVWLFAWFIATVRRRGRTTA
jgi:hypothetical protein